MSIIIKSVPERNIDVQWVKEQIFSPLKTLKNCGFRVRAKVSDNYSANVLAYKPLLKESSHLDDNLFIEQHYHKIYWLHDALHLIKNVRNNLLNYKRFIFPAFEYDGFKNSVLFRCSHTSWKLHHLLEANLRKAPK